VNAALLKNGYSISQFALAARLAAIRRDTENSNWQIAVRDLFTTAL
jgi:hypothetical protein